MATDNSLLLPDSLVVFTRDTLALTPRQGRVHVRVVFFLFFLFFWVGRILEHLIFFSISLTNVYKNNIYYFHLNNDFFNRT